MLCPDMAAFSLLLQIAFSRTAGSRKNARKTTVRETGCNCKLTYGFTSFN